MMSAVLALMSLVATIGIGCSFGARAAFCWGYWPILALVPQEVVLELPILPDLNCARMAIAGVLVATALRGDLSRSSRWRALDVLPALMVLSYSISFGLRTDFMGFVHSVSKLLLDWGLPYYLARLLLREWRDIASLLRSALPIAVCLGLIALYEMRMAARPLEEFWQGVGVPVSQLEHFGQWRAGLLRAHAHFGHPLTMACFFAFVLPLVGLLRRVYESRRSMGIWALHGLAWTAVAGGVVSSLSRGPIAVMVVMVPTMMLVDRWPRAVMWCGMGVACIIAPWVAGMLADWMVHTEQGLIAEGNVESSYYRLALLMLYGSNIADYGMWGDPSRIGADYEAAWSIDNSYLYQFIMGGMIGGSMFALFTIGVMVRGYVAVMANDGGRPVSSRLWSSFVAISLCLANVWFSADISTFYWIMSALVMGLPLGGLVKRHKRVAVARLANLPSASGSRVGS